MNFHVFKNHTTKVMYFKQIALKLQVLIQNSSNIFDQNFNLIPRYLLYFQIYFTESTMCSKDEKKLFFGILVLVFLEIPDLVLDVDFCVQIYKTEQPQIKNNSSLWVASVFFCSIGFVTFAVELINLLCNCCRRDKYFLPGIFSLASTLAEDVPQIVIAMYVAFVEEKRITNVQYGKAGFAIFEALVRNIILILYIRGKNSSSKRTKRGKMCVAVTQLVIGVCIFICSIIIIVKL